MEKIGQNCPVNNKLVNEIVIRLLAMQVIFITATALFFQNPYVALGLLTDFGFRAFGYPVLSPLKFVAQNTADHFQLGYKPTNEAPKKFAAKIGFLVVVLLTGILFLQIHWLSYTIGIGLLLFALLESGFGICVGCMMYQQLARFRWFNSI